MTTSPGARAARASRRASASVSAGDGAMTRRRPTARTQKRPSWTAAARRGSGCDGVRHRGGPARRDSGERGLGRRGRPSSSGSRREVRLEHARASAACRARPPGGRADRARRASRRARPPARWPWTRVIPAGLPERSFVAKLPSVATTCGPDQLDLAEEMRLAGLDLLRLRIAVPGRAALEHVRDVDVRRASGRSRRAACRAASRPAPTNGTPCLSSWKPGASPTNIRSASASADAEHDLRPASGERAARAAEGLAVRGERRSR